MLGDAEHEELLARARRLRTRVAELDDGAEIDAAVRAHVQHIADPPEPPPRHGALIAELIGLLEDERLSSEQRRGLERALLGT